MSGKAKAKIGRPVEYTPEIGADICDRLVKGESIRSMCEDDLLPSARTVHRWLGSEGEWAASFRQQYALAREAQADAKFDEADTIAKAATPENVQVARLQIDTIKWQTAKLAPKKYGERLDLNNNIGVQDSLAELMKAIDGKSRGLPG